MKKYKKYTSYHWSYEQDSTNSIFEAIFDIIVTAAMLWMDMFTVI